MADENILPVSGVVPTPAAVPVVPVVPTPVAAAPVVEQPVVPALPVQPVAGETPKTGHVGLDMALKFFTKAGLDLNSAEMEEAGKGNFEYLEAKFKSMGAKAPDGWQEHLALAKDGQQFLTNKDKTEYEARQKIVHDAVGGEENWKQIAEFVKANAEPAERAEINAAFMQGGLAARAMAEMLGRQFSSSTSVSKEPAPVVTQQANAPAAGAQLSLSGYRQELNALVSKIGANRLDGSPEYTSLRRKYAHVTR